MSEITELAKYLSPKLSARAAVVNLKDFILDPTTNNADNIAAAIQATPIGGTLIGPENDIYTGPIDINKTINVIFPGKLIRHSGTNFSGLVRISGQNVTFRCREVDMNAYQVTGWSGAAHIIDISGAGAYVYRTQASNSPDIIANRSLSRGFNITAPGCLIEDSTTYRTGDGFRFTNIATLDVDGRPVGDGVVRRCRAFEYFNKGFTIFQNCGVITFDDVAGTVSPTYEVDGSCLVQADAGDGFRCYKFVVKNSNLIPDAAGSIKIVNCRYVVIENTKILHNFNGPRAIDFQDQYIGDPVAYQECDVFIRNVEIENPLITSNYIFRADTMFNVRCENVNFLRPATTNVAAACWIQKSAIFIDCGWNSGNFANARAIEDGGQTKPGTKRIVVIRPRNLQSNQHDVFRRYTSNMPISGEFSAVDLIGNWRISNSPDWDMLIQRNSGGPPTSLTTASTPAVPATLGTFERGFNIASHIPQAGSISRWVCTASGTLDSINTTGNINSGANTLTVASATNIFVGSFITIAGVSGIKRVTAVSGTTITIDSTANATVTGAAVANSPATFIALPRIPLSGSKTYDPPSLGDGATTTETVTVTGAALGDFARASFSVNPQGITITAQVTATNTVTVTFTNHTGGTIDLGSGTLRAEVTKP